MITLRNITLRRGSKVLLEQANWTIYHKQRIGLIGANGTGKSSLFAMLLGEISSDVGELEIPRQIKFAHVAQEAFAYAGSAIEFVLDGDHELRYFESELKKAEEQDNGEKIALLHDKLGIIDAYTANARAAQLLIGLGFTHEEQQKSVNEFSGGWRVRLNLAQTLMSRSDILLLDEPTNHLDLDAVVWLEEWLKKYQGTLLLISHDRDFLDNIVDHIAHLDRQELTIYTGNYSTFEAHRANALLLQQAVYEKQQRQLAHMQSFVDRFRAKASKARQAQSRLKAIEKMDLVCAVQLDSPFQFHFKPPKQCPNPLLTLDRVNAGYGDHLVLNHINLSLTPKDRIAILGPNGAGKSTLIKLIAGELAPLKGKLETSPGLKIGYFAQHQVEQLHLDETALWHLQEIAEKTAEVELRKFLGSFGFSKDRVLEPVKQFSGGEKSRLTLALLVWQRPNLLLLDEPTNHLDMEMRQALSLALQEYEGAMILVSHDRFLVRTTTDQLLLVADKKLVDFTGDLNDYQKWLLDYRKQKKELAKSQEPETPREPKNDLRSQRKLQQQIKQLENKLNQLQKEYAEIETELSDTAIYAADKNQILQQTIQRQNRLKQEIEQIELTWLNACQENDDMNKL